jgi:hypothetical protein
MNIDGLMKDLLRKLMVEIPDLNPIGDHARFVLSPFDKIMPPLQHISR